ncbi:uncharacterized protein NECHADRAFT_84360 [Fusarium vanettenii 77-13-4]|uniref:AAA+ ATPase domain-containing protein n=1 Tax=Fusarium vanettenii (strain ATCC MYA-4622 / CBS 123669 / FGSC 9596 / NRRL 45880 / 77-13-4) TaxID=660122 RepID=C7ZCW3_FUSV7|nr:uncharacterized protein NECHADRAFT_84360 [Fusarium vanettenii 77-13-4]EEU38115.1 hypothetical protein NECHADRAFT_84360 [Fusarium vanettenii 77-13-4]
MSFTDAQLPSVAPTGHVSIGDAETPAFNACERCGHRPAIPLRQHDSDITLLRGPRQPTKESSDLGKETLSPSPPSQLGGSEKSAHTRADDDADSERKMPSPEWIQEVKITRVAPEEWRQVKKEGKIDPRQSVLLVSSKACVETNLRRKRPIAVKASAAKKTTVDSVANESKQLDVPYRLALNSPFLLDAIGQCIGVNLAEAQNVLVRPFKYLVWNDNAVARRDDEQSDTATEVVKATIDRAKRQRDEFRCLLEFMDRDMAEIFEIKRQISNKTLKAVAFEHLWQLFRPGSVAYRSVTEDGKIRYQAVRILHVTGGRVCFDSGKKCSFDPVRDRNWEPESETEETCREIIKSSDLETTSFLIDCFYIDFDGFRLGPRPKRFVIQRYKGTRPIHSLPLYPSLLHPEDHKIQEMLLTRGEQFIKLAPGAHRRYDGRTIRESNLTALPFNNFVINEAEVHGEVMVDQRSGVEHFKSSMFKWNLKLGGGILFDPTQSDSRETFDPLPKKQDDNWVTDVVDDSQFEADCRTDFLQSTDLLSFQSLGGHVFSDERLKLLPQRLYGYSFVDHKWLALDIDCLCDIPPRFLTPNFEDLVLPNGHGKLLRALIKNHIRSPEQSPAGLGEIAEGLSMDVVAGKGKGLIILFHGPPGVGKTSTAECVAAELKRPLVSITCGKIGTNARQAEQSLESFCTLAQKWKCVLLLDEAEIFLAKREKGDIERNTLVSVFLRVLEYYSEIIILTTNRVGEFDEAFRSRIHVSLYYPKLDQSSTKEIWEKNISRLKAIGTYIDVEVDVEEDKIRQFVDQHWELNKGKPSRRWNGRQIKNAFQTAIAMAKWDFYDAGRSTELERPFLKAAHFKFVARTSDHFDDYVRDIHGFQEEEDAYSILAGREDLRQDDDPGPFAKHLGQESGRAGKRLPVRRGTNPYHAGLAQTRGYDLDDDLDEDEGNEVRRLELELELARLKSQKGLRAEATRSLVGDDDDEIW